jgi:hypothetical protein
MIIELKADVSALERQVGELRALWLEAGQVPQSILQDLRDLADKPGHELAFGSELTTRRADEHVVEICFREGGKFDRCMAALRALRDGREIG